WEGLIARLQRQHWLLLVTPLLIAAGKTRQLASARRTESLKPAAFPYRYDLLEALKAAAESGRRVVLMGGDTPELRAAGEYLGFEIEAIDASGKPSRSGRLLELAPGGFDYVA